MNTSKKHWGWTLWASCFSVAAASAIGFCVGYQSGFNAYLDAYIDGLVANIHYVGNPVDYPKCDKGIKYEWFYVEPPADIHQSEGERAPTARQKGGDNMSP